MPPKRVVEQSTFATQPIIALPTLDLFSRRSMQASVMNMRQMQTRPVGFFSADSAITFDIPASTTEFLWPRVYLQIKCKIVNDDGSDLAADALVAPIANFANGMWSDIELKMNNTVVSNRSGLHPFFSYINTGMFIFLIFCCCYTQTKFAAFLTGANTIPTLDGPSVVYLDTRAQFDTINDTNEGFKMRRTLFQKSRSQTLYFPVETEVLMQDKLILPNVNMQITLNPTRNAFRIMSGVNAPIRYQKLIISKFLYLYNNIFFPKHYCEKNCS